LTKTDPTPTTTATNQVLRPLINLQVPKATSPEEAASHLKVVVLKAQAPENLEADPVLIPLKTTDLRPFCPVTTAN